MAVNIYANGVVCLRYWIVSPFTYIGPSVCLNGGNCSTYGYCICPFGYTGQFCETSKLALVVVLVDVHSCVITVSPHLLGLTVCGNNTICYNNATCENGRCVCSGPYTGYNCSTEICECLSVGVCAEW